MKKTLLILTIVFYSIWFFIGTGFIVAGAIFKTLFFQYHDLLLIIGMVIMGLLFILSIAGTIISILLAGKK